MIFWSMDDGRGTIDGLEQGETEWKLELYRKISGWSSR